MATRKEIAFRKKCDELVRQAGRMEGAAVKRTIQLLADARKTVAAEIASTPWEAYHLPQMKGAIQRAMEEFGMKYKVALGDAQTDFWELGKNRVDLPLRTVGITIAIPEIDITALSIMQDFSADLVKGLAADASKRISQEISMGLMGQKTPYEVMKAVGTNLKDPSVFKSIAARAETITRNEAGRVLEMAAQARAEKAAEVVPGLMKEWRHGAGAMAPRMSHLAADGQVRKVNEPFDVGGEKLMYPRDPAGSPGNTINCGCYTVPYHPDWDEASEGQRAA
jgi:hypothetical protein